MVRRRYYRLAVATAATAIVLDQLSKTWAVARLEPMHRSIAVAPFLSLALGLNTRVHFGPLAPHSPAVAGGLTILIALALLIWAGHHGERRAALAAGLVAGGAIGNIASRLALGAVPDFLLLHGFGQETSLFNLADVAIVAGGVLLVVDFLARRRVRPPSGGQAP